MGWPGPVTNRQFRLWDYWLNRRWHEHTKEEYYLAQIAMEVVRSQSSKPGKFKLKQFLLKFGVPDKDPGGRKLTKKEMIEAAKAKWIGITSLGTPRDRPGSGGRKADHNSQLPAPAQGANTEPPWRGIE
jgi:hypothetical protein